MKLVIDSNIFISSLDPNDLFHAECSPAFEKLLELETEQYGIPLLTKAKEIKAKAPKSILVFEPVDRPS